MTGLLILLLLSLVVVLAFLLGFRLGTGTAVDEIRRVRESAELASREMHDVTRAAFEAMAEEAHRRRTTR